MGRLAVNWPPFLLEEITVEDIKLIEYMKSQFNCNERMARTIIKSMELRGEIGPYYDAAHKGELDNDTETVV